jgi:Tfp pilus assembly protein PilF
LALGQSELARKDLEEVLEIDPTSAPAHFRLARAYHQAKDRNAARHEFDRANALGLTEAKLDPLERRTYIRLRNELTTQ